ncbi:TnsA endonuclease N-terminal domain-containing protein [Bradyrhizobium sp. RP6]|uniref:TnsA endonuclease N-terminal domain-containing protein n=1 Tax=Bradyrhizobium sp. RP6 TaxID=2489596 RepID=UPI000F52678E|nr:TnsA endonuclease N-terminal domain-containing protein [Bradyrhizobium sp. RP6]RQH12666.1 hypothetical protein EHH60_14335 [Bradyrhizobium sp. RP6]
MSVQTRAMHIGRSDASRKVVTYRSGHFTGFVPSRKNKDMVQYESILERDYIQLLESDPDVLKYSEQPKALRWSDGVQNYKTTFDFVVTRRDGTKYLVEVKPLAKVIKYKLNELYGYARAAAIAKGYSDLELWTDREIRAMPRLGNAELIVSSETGFREQAFELALFTAIASMRRHADRATIRELRAASKLGTAAYWQIIRMVARGQLIPADATAPLDDRAILMFGGERICA